jgi:hypothetical protein
MRKRRNSPLWAYLEASGVLVKGSDEDIKAAKRAYRKKYLSDFKKNQRNKTPEFAVRFSKDNGELERIAEAAKKHHLSVPAFLKCAAFAYLERTYIVPNRLLVAHLAQLLSDCLNEIKSISSHKERFWERESKLDRIEKRIIKLEGDVSDLFRTPTLFSNDHQNQIT